VTLVYCGQTVGWIKIPLGTKVDLGPGHIVVDGHPATTPSKGAHPNFRPMSVVVKRSPISATAEHLLSIAALMLDYNKINIKFTTHNRSARHMKLIFYNVP